MRNTDTKQILLSKAHFAKKNNFFCTANLHALLVKVLKCETTSFHYSSPRVPNPFKKIGYPTSKKRLNGTSKVNGRTHTRTHGRTFQLIESIGP